MLSHAQIQNSGCKGHDCLDEAVPTGYGRWGLAVVHGLVPASVLAKPIKERETNKAAECYRVCNSFQK
jgi:hypothetical protein